MLSKSTFNRGVLDTFVLVLVIGAVEDLDFGIFGSLTCRGVGLVKDFGADFCVGRPIPG